LSGAVGVAVEGVDFGVVDDAVDHGGATAWSPKTSPYTEKARLLVRMIEGRS
jgi:hypothetical protein